jgi:hypothetical protein
MIPDSAEKRKQIAFCPVFHHNIYTMMRRFNLRHLSLPVLMIAIMWSVHVSALSSSAHYEVNEEFFGSGAENDAISTNYQSNETLGELAAGYTSSPTYAIHAGFETTDNPLLTVSVTGGTFALGTVTSAATADGSTSFSVENYLSHGYIVDIVGNGPYDGSHTITDLTTPSNPVNGTEGFGINLTANTVPSVGAVPQQIPNNTFSFGQVASNYDTANKFLFNTGDEIAYSNTSSGETTYTMSFIETVAASTPSGAYDANLEVIAIPTF